MAAGDVSDRDAAFWDELCGSSLARELGVTDASPESLRASTRPTRLYPYVLAQVSRSPREIEDQLEYPGQIKVTVIRESRAVEVARNTADGAPAVGAESALDEQAKQALGQRAQ